MKALALDFDGVISDSAAESFWVAVRTYAALRSDSRFAGLAAELGSASLDTIRGHAVYRDFLTQMPLGNRAEDFGVVLSVLDAGGFARDQAEYDAYRSAEAPGFLRDFHERFYRERSALRDADPKAWIGLLSPYASMVDLIRRRARDVTLCIATAKDRTSVELLLAHYGIGDLFPAERVIDKEHGTSKRAHLMALRERLGVAFADITFVDDKFNHLEDVSGLGVRAALAGWGYNGEREWQLARAAGHLVLQVSDAEVLLFDSPPA